jgi:outer membrane protein assembly factor BamB
MIKIILIIISIGLISCGSKEDNSKKKEKKNESKTTQVRSENSALSWYDIENEDIPAINLPDELKEISGITFTDDNRLFAHGDEDGDVYQLNPETGQIIKSFALGDMLVVKGDFEDITYANDKFFLVES